MYVPVRRDYNFFDEMFRPFIGQGTGNDSTARLMKTDIKENAESFDIIIDLPGYAKEDIKAELKDGYLNITAERNTNTESTGEDGKFIRKERFSGTCKRSFYVGDYLKEDDIGASFKDGVLCLNIPKEGEPVQEEPKYIAIN